MVSKKQQILDRVYNDPTSTGGFGGVQRLYKAAKLLNSDITLADVKDYLKSSDAYTLHYLQPKKFARRRVLSPKPRVYVSVDLAEMGKLAGMNNGIKYLLVCVNIYSRFAQVVPLTSKDANIVCRALKSILETPHSRGVRKINSDHRGEFYNARVKKMLASKKIVLYSVFSQETKASIAERFIRTLKTKLYKYMTSHNTLKYIGVLPDVVKTYNVSPHRGLGGRTPREVHALTKPREIVNLFNLMYKNPGKTSRGIIPQLKVGETVRITLSDRVSKFKKGFKQQNTREIFTIARVDNSQRVPLYYLKDLNGGNIDGGFYRQELTLTHLPAAFNIEKVLSKREVDGQLQYKVRYEGYDQSFDQWVDADDVLKL
ncbi:uncharacterized protein [Procambarus clarkii]|uniref:uncharacterized protein n=1 Tax=Procambarus clarkii TaxID=6728 RepID=UPI003743345D